MDKKNITREIQNLLEAITEQTEVICSYEQNVPQIELDIIKVNIRDLYEAYIQLDKLNRQSDKQAVKTTAIPPDFNKLLEEKVIVVEVPLVKTTPVEEIKVVEIENIPQPEIIKIVEPVIDEPKQEAEPVKELYSKPSITEEAPVKPLEKTIEKPVEKPVEKQLKKPVDLFSDATTMSDKFKSDTRSINDKMAQSKTDASISSKINKVQVDDLKKAIGINEKFRFVNELFDGNLTDYTDAITKLNDFDNIQSAFSFFDSLKLKFKWDEKSNTFLTLKELLNRRFLK